MIDPQHIQIADWIKTTIITLVGTVVGFSSAVFTDIIKTRINERHKRKGMRKALYEELAGIWETYDAALEVNDPTAEQADMLLRVISAVSTDAYKNAKAQPEVFYGLKEAATIDALYVRVNALKSQYVLPGAGKAALSVAKDFRNDFAEALGSERLDPNIFTIGKLKDQQLRLKVRSVGTSS